jgi:hypothetical protein
MPPGPLQDLTPEQSRAARALHDAGVVFLDEGELIGGGAGVRLRKGHL